MSTFFCHWSKYLALLPVLKPSNKSVDIVPANQSVPGLAYPSPLFISIKLPAKTSIAGFSFANFNTSFKSVLEIPGTSKPCLFHASILATS